MFWSFQFLCFGSSNELAYATEVKSEPEDADKDGRNHISPVEDDSRWGGIASTRHGAKIESARHPHITYGFCQINVALRAVNPAFGRVGTCPGIEYHTGN